MKHYIL